jgi:hypothetical protein
MKREQSVNIEIVSLEGFTPWVCVQNRNEPGECGKCLDVGITGGPSGEEGIVKGVQTASFPYSGICECTSIHIAGFAARSSPGIGFPGGSGGRIESGQPGARFDCRG